MDKKQEQNADAFLRKWLVEQYHVILKSESGVIAGEIEPLHDMRVGMRRIRTLLWAFRKPLADTPAISVGRRLKAFSDQLGPSRDIDVFLIFLKSRLIVKTMAGRSGWLEFINKQQLIQNEKKNQLRQLLQGDLYRRLKMDFASFLDKGLPMESLFPIPVSKLAHKTLRKALDRVRSRGEALPIGLPPEEMHALRISCRRARYLAEFFAEILGKPVEILGHRLRNVQDVLGDVHDLDVQLELFRLHRLKPPVRLIRELRTCRGKKAELFRTAWDRLVRHVSWEKPNPSADA